MGTSSTMESGAVDTAKYDHSTTLAQLEFFIRLGNMPELEPNNHFGAILNLGNALIAGDHAAIKLALSYYTNQTKILFEHIEYLNRAFAHAGVSFQEPAVMRYDNGLGQMKTMVVISIFLERAGKVVFVSNDASLASYVHSFTDKAGVMTMQPAKEDPQLLLKQISRVIRIPDVVAPPPFSITTHGLL